jgi:hypothetical protein
LIHFQDAEVEYIESLVWCQGFNRNIIHTINRLFDTRLRYKKEGNPVQNVIKLVLNAGYGKMIQKPITNEIKMISAKKGKSIDDFMSSNINRLIMRTDVAFDSEGAPTHALFELHRNVIHHESPAHLGVMVLSMSKRIMNEVMCLAEDEGHTIYYQDTDSMHIKAEQVEPLADRFKEIYGRELIGAQMGQFNSDFDLEGAKGEIVATESIFLGKKSYYDRLVSTDGVEGEHCRMKSIPSRKLKEVGAYDLYCKLYPGEAIELECAKYCPIDINSKTQKVKKRTKFVRTLQF